MKLHRILFVSFSLYLELLKITLENTLTLMISVCLLFNLFVLTYSQNNLPAYFMWPSLIPTTLSDMTQIFNQATGTTATYLSMETTDFYVSRLSSEGKLQIYNIETGALMFNSFKDSSTQAEVPPIIAYDLLNNDTGGLAVVSNDNQGYFFHLYPNGNVEHYHTTDKVLVTANPRYDVQLFKSDEYMLCVTNFGTGGFSRWKKTANWFLGSGFYSVFKTPANNLKMCQPKPTDNFFRIAMWKRNCYIVTAKCPTNGTYVCKQEYIFNNTACNSVDEYKSPDKDYFKIAWNQDCTKVAFQSKNQGLRMVDVTANKSLGALAVTSATSPLSGFWFLDNFDQFLGVYKPNGSFETYNLSSMKLVESKALTASNVAAYNRLRNDLFVSDGSKLLSYNLGCTEDNFTLIDGLCVTDSPFVLPQPNSNQTLNDSNNIIINDTGTLSIPDNSTDSSSGNSTSLLNDTKALNNTINNILDLISKNQSLLNQTKQYIDQLKANTDPNSELYQLLKSPMGKYFEESTTSFLSAIAKPVEYSNAIIKAMPMSFLYIGYVNFWFVISLYKFAPVPLPDFLAIQLNAVYDMISSSMFQNFGWEINVGTDSQQKFQQKWVDDGLTSNLIRSNMENFIMILISYAILSLLYYTQTQLPQKNIIRKKLHGISYKLAFSGQFIGIMNAFYFNLPIITKKAYQDVFQEKINMALQNFFFIFSTSFSCLVFFIISEMAQKKRTRVERTCEKLNWFFDSQCNCLLPIFVMFDIIPLFLAFNAIFFFIPIYTAWKQKSCIFKIISLVKSLYLEMFNTGIILIAIFNCEMFNGMEYDDTKSIITLITTCVVGIGAAHEVLQLLCGILYDIFKMLRSLKNRVANQNEDEQRKELDQNETQKINVVTKKDLLKSTRKVIHVDESRKCLQTINLQDSAVELNKSMENYEEGNNQFINDIGKRMKMIEKKVKTKIRLKKFKPAPEGAKTVGVLNDNLKVNFDTNHQEKSQIEDDFDSDIEEIVETKGKSIGQNAQNPIIEEQPIVFQGDYHKVQQVKPQKADQPIQKEILEEKIFVPQKVFEPQKVVLPGKNQLPPKEELPRQEVQKVEKSEKKDEPQEEKPQNDETRVEKGKKKKKIKINCGKKDKSGGGNAAKDPSGDADADADPEEGQS